MLLGASFISLVQVGNAAVHVHFFSITLKSRGVLHVKLLFRVNAACFMVFRKMV